MAHVQNANTYTSSLSARFYDLIAGFKADRARRERFDQTYSKLRTLSDSELVEFGLHRSDLVDLARTEAMKTLR